MGTNGLGTNGHSGLLSSNGVANAPAAEPGSGRRPASGSSVTNASRRAGTDSIMKSVTDPRIYCLSSDDVDGVRHVYDREGCDVQPAPCATDPPLLGMLRAAVHFAVWTCASQALLAVGRRADRCAARRRRMRVSEELAE